MIDSASSRGVDKPRWTTHIGNGNTNKYIITYYITASDGRSASVFPPQPTFHVADLTLTVRPLLVRVHFIRRKKLRSVFGSLDFLEPEITEAGIMEPQLQKGEAASYMLFQWWPLPIITASILNLHISVLGNCQFAYRRHQGAKVVAATLPAVISAHTISVQWVQIQAVQNHVWVPIRPTVNKLPVTPMLWTTGVSTICDTPQSQNYKLTWPHWSCWPRD